MSPEYLRKLADIADPDETWRTADLLDYLRLSEEKRQQHDTGVALRRYAEHLERVKRAMEEKRSVLITPLSESGCAVRLADTPKDHARLRDKRADMQPAGRRGLNTRSQRMTNDDAQTYSHSECGEMYYGKYASPEEAAAAYFRDGGENSEVWVGLNCVPGHASQYVKADDICTLIEENAGDEVGEAANNWLCGLTTEDLEELKTMIGNWLQSKAPPDFCYVKELRKIPRSELPATGHLQPPEAGG